MPKTNSETSLERFIADPRLMELCELQRTGDEVLDVISLNENQHSDILGWLFDSKEGHGQGDEILRDLLIHASELFSAQETAIDGRSATARFFGAWPPSRIRTTSFGSAFVARELGLKARERVDLFVVDTQNQFILVIENKAGTAHNETQLDLYRSGIDALIAGNSRLKQYDYALIALDRYLDAENPGGISKFWLPTNYDWLKVSAKRALMHVGRGNSAAKLVVSYCNRQTDWDSPVNEQCLEIAAQLTNSYPDAVRSIVGLWGGRIEKQWLASSADNASLLFLLQNRGIFRLLREVSGLVSVKSAIVSEISSLPRDNVEHQRAWLEICPRWWERYKGELWWPVFLSVRYSDSAKSKYTLALVWNADYARNEDEATQLRSILAKIEKRFEKHSDSRRRRVVIKVGVGLVELLATIKDLESRLARSVEAL